MFGGLASARFHRPDSGQGLNGAAQAHIKSMRMLTAELDIFHCTPDAECQLLSEREPNEAYLTCIAGEQYALYFPDGGAVTLDLTDAPGRFTARWLDITHSTWGTASTMAGGDPVNLETPGAGHWAVLLRKK